MSILCTFLPEWWRRRRRYWWGWVRGRKNIFYPEILRVFWLISVFGGDKYWLAKLCRCSRLEINVSDSCV